MKLARGQARSVIPPTAPMCRKGPVAWGGKKNNPGCQPTLVSVSKIHMLQCQGSAPAASTAGRSTVPGREGQVPGGQNRLPALVQPPFISLVAAAPGRTAGAGGAHCLVKQQKSRSGNKHAVAHSRAEDFSQHFSAQPHRPGTGYSGGVPAMDVTHLQGDTCTLPLLRPLYSQPCEGCSHHQSS